MDKAVLEDIKELFQSFIAPQLEGIQGDIRALDTKLDAKFETLDTKIESCRRELSAEIRRVEVGSEARYPLSYNGSEAGFNGRQAGLPVRLHG